MNNQKNLILSTQVAQEGLNKILNLLFEDIKNEKPSEIKAIVLHFIANYTKLNAMLSVYLSAASIKNYKKGKANNEFDDIMKQFYKGKGK